MFTKQDISYHLAFCPNKPHTCIYCSLELDPSLIQEHEDLCGSKTEKCANCEKFIPIKSKFTYIPNLYNLPIIEYNEHKKYGCYKDDIYLNNSINIDNILRENNNKARVKKKGGLIAETIKMGLINNKNNNKGKWNKGNKIEGQDHLK